MTYWCIDNCMNINPSKAKLFILGTLRSSFVMLCLNVAQLVLNTWKYNYLGVDFTEHLNQIQLIENTPRSASKTANYQSAKARICGALVYV